MRTTASWKCVGARDLLCRLHVAHDGHRTGSASTLGCVAHVSRWVCVSAWGGGGRVVGGASEAKPQEKDGIDGWCGGRRDCRRRGGGLSGQQALAALERAGDEQV